MSLIAERTLKAKLDLAEARRELEEAMDNSVRAALVKDAAVTALGVVDRLLRGLVERLAEVLADERDEARIHEVMSDLLHGWLDTAGAKAEAATAAVGLGDFGARFRRGARPRALLTVSQWADRHRWLSSGTNAPGQWRTSLTPYLREVMDDLSEHSPVKRVVLMKGSGIGGTEGVLFNWIGYVMHHLANKDLLIVVSNLELRDRSFNPRLEKMLRETPVLADVLKRATESRSAKSSAAKLEYSPLAKLVKAGANSPDSLSSDHVPYAVLDEVDRYPWDVGGEGDPLKLIENRQRTFSRAKTLLLSTPTNEHVSRIAIEYQESDRRRYHVPCPHCGELQPLERERFLWRFTPGDDSRIVDRAWFVCVACGGEIDEHEKPEMLARGRWIAERPEIKLVHGYLLPSCYSPIGLGFSWRKLAQRMVSSDGDDTARKAVLNTDWAEVYQDEKEAVDDHSLIARCEHYSLDLLLAAGKIRCTTAWADVQKDRLEVTIVAWGDGEEAWVIDHVILPGATAEDGVWTDYDETLDAYAVDYAGVDSGYNTKMAHAFCRDRRWCTPTKGVAGFGRPIVQDKVAMRQRLRRATKTRYGSRPAEPIGVDQAKKTIFDRLAIQTPGPRYLHFPVSAAIDREYFAQLAAEELRTRRIRGRVEREWVNVRPRNEALDCLVGNLAIFLVAQTLEMRAARRLPAKATKPQPAEEARGQEQVADAETSGKDDKSRSARTPALVSLDGWRR